MELKDFLGTDLKYDVKTIADDENLTCEIQAILIDLNMLNPPIDGIFGPLTTAALHRFQVHQKSGEPGYLGEKTIKKLFDAKEANIPATPIVLKTKKDTILKSKPLQSSQLTDLEKHHISADQEFELLAYVPVRNHFRIAFRDHKYNNTGVWYIHEKHIEIYEKNQIVHPKSKPEHIRIKVPYKPKLDDWYNPAGLSNITSIASCLEFLQTNRKSNYGKFEDELYEYALSQGYSRHNPYHLVKIVRDYGCQDNFKTNATIAEIQDWLLVENPVVIHSYFTSFGHLIVGVGFDNEGLFIHDPYGEWSSTGYRTDLSGAYLHYSYRLIRNICMPDGNFWVHFISK
ncbi:C39 family peptidase [Okeania sp.]|uniref:C39 family peptidase n=1 Tax=Okeania sp. TaxID=3100323 RepID=UPI002B4AD961|nr:C39 family peptidase [Okeania sp.]MEB3341230.1 C39 family peptidase [Okeania sp.]